MPSDDPLEGLRALHLPPEPASFWTDIGFAAAAGLALALVVALVARALWRPRRSLRASALDALEEAKSLPPPERRAAQAALLRRVVRTIGGDEAARASGDDWAATLDRTFGVEFFTAGAGRALATGLYAPPGEGPADQDAIDRTLATLLRKLRR